VSGDEHPDTLTAMNNLAMTLRAFGELRSARLLLKRVLEARRRVLGDEHPDTLTALNQLEACSVMGVLRDARRQRLGHRRDPGV
jgi:hypothetical protein